MGGKVENDRRVENVIRFDYSKEKKSIVIVEKEEK